jgi:hypothetical protein
MSQRKMRKPWDKPIPVTQYQGDPVFHGRAVSQDLYVHHESSFFPEKLECVLELEPKDLKQETTLDIFFEHLDSTHRVEDVYTIIPAYADICWGDPKHIKGVRHGNRFSLDGALTVSCLSYGVSFPTYQEGVHTILANQALPYGGTPLPDIQGGGLDTVAQTSVYWVPEGPQGAKPHKTLRGKAFGDCVRAGVIVFRLEAKHIRQKIYEPAVLDADENKNASNLFASQEYESHWYTMIDAKTMRVTLARKQR